MLYDQGQLAVAYLDAFQILGDPHLNPQVGIATAEERREADAKAPVRIEFEKAARDILDYVPRDMTSREGGFFSAEDADSPVPVAAVSDRRAEAGQQTDVGAQSAPLQKTAEGAFYVWTKKEIDDALGDAAEIFDFHYGVQPHGNAPEGSDPQDEFRGKNILIERHTISKTAKHFRKAEKEIGNLLAQSRAKLFSIRAKRPRPHLDDKIISGWNGLMISAYARGYQVLGDAADLETAQKAARFIKSDLYDAKEHRLYRRWRDGEKQVPAFADDYAFVV